MSGDHNEGNDQRSGSCAAYISLAPESQLLLVVVSPILLMFINDKGVSSFMVQVVFIPLWRFQILAPKAPGSRIALHYPQSASFVTHESLASGSRLLLVVVGPILLMFINDKGVSSFMVQVLSHNRKSFMTCTKKPLLRYSARASIFRFVYFLILIHQLLKEIPHPLKPRRNLSQS